MTEQKEKKFTRREMIKATGLVALGLTYSKPFIETVQARPAFNNYDPGKYLGGYSPGYWKNKNGKHPWPEGYSPDQDFDETFGLEPGTTGETLGSALEGNASDGDGNLPMHAVAALLNAAYFEEYSLEPDDVIDLIVNAYNSSSASIIKALAEWLDNYHQYWWDSD
jgi:hypothetical protein